MGFQKIYKQQFICFFLLNSIVFGQSFEIIEDSGKKPIIVGITAREVYQDSNFSSWFNSEYTRYNLNTKLLDQIKHNFEGKIIKIVLGTWCSDSKREVPRFVKILDFIDFPFDKVLFINVNREKQGLTKEVDGLEIDFVPTYIIYENGKEIGRIIESPLKSLEEDLASIIQSTD